MDTRGFFVLLFSATGVVCSVFCVVVRLDVYRGGDDLGGDALQQAVAKNGAMDRRVQVYCPSLPLHMQIHRGAQRQPQQVLQHVSPYKTLQTLQSFLFIWLVVFSHFAKIYTSTLPVGCLPLVTSPINAKM